MQLQLVEMRNCPSNRASSHQAGQDIPLVPKQEILDFDFPSHSVLQTDVGDNAASSSGSNVRPILIRMGFQGSLVNKMIEEKGEDDFDLLLDALVTYTEGPQISNPESPDSLDNLYGDKVPRGMPEVPTRIHLKEEPDIADNVDDSKIASLLSMNFSLEEVNFAMDKLGKDAPIDGFVDFIVAAQIAKRLEQVAEDISDDDKEINEEINNDVLFGTMDKSLRLLEMGFSEIQVSWAIENCGAEFPISELADSIITGRIPVKKSIATGSQCRPSSSGIDPVKLEFEGFHADTVPQEMDVNLDSVFLGKKLKQENAGDSSQTVPRSGFKERNEILNGKRPKPEDDYVSDSFQEPNLFYEEEKFNPEFDRDGTPEPLNKRPRKPLTGLVAKPPYFLYGVVGDMSHESWAKARKFLYNLEPEFVNTHHFSALSRNEGYIHNLPTEERFETDPKLPMTIEEAMPHTKKWWPVWDPRKRLDCINDEPDGVPSLCDMLGRSMNSTRGSLSAEQQRSILNHCRSRNLVWVGRNRLGAIEPMYLEIILGYPANHTDGFSSLMERLQSLKHSFQPDTLGYHLSVLKPMFPGGLTLLSIFSGIGGTEIALNRLGVPLKAVVSVEPCETKRKILKKWWQSSCQTGELVQIEEIQKLTSSRLSSLVGKFGFFDLVVCQRRSLSSATQNGDRIFGFDFSLFCEFTRVLQRVRGMGG